MVIVIIGGSGSGKSAYAESLIADLSKEQKRYYLATMQVYDKEGKRKIARHQSLREGKGFETVEQPINIGDAAAKIDQGAVVLLECMSNLVANEMFTPYPAPALEAVKEKILAGIRELIEKSSTLVIVSNNVFEDGIAYDASTMEYIRVLGQINQQLSGYADQVIEVIAGIGCNRKQCQSRSLRRTETDTVNEKIALLRQLDGRGKGMELYIGGCCQGKLNYVRQLHAQEDFIIWDGDELAGKEGELKEQLSQDRGIIMNHFHKYVKSCLEQGENPEKILQLLSAHYAKLIVISDEIGNGIVPIDAMEREYRERLGRIQCELALHAERMERIICGMGQRLK